MKEITDDKILKRIIQIKYIENSMKRITVKFKLIGETNKLNQLINDTKLFIISTTTKTKVKVKATAIVTATATSIKVR